MNISDILKFKGHEVITTSPRTSVTTLLALLAEHNIGALVVTSGADVVGIVSERDVVRRLNEEGRDLLDGTVEQLMSTTVVSCASGDSLEAVAATMTENRIRHLPVIDNGRLSGIVTIGDVVLSRTRQLEDDRRQLEQYISG